MNRYDMSFPSIISAELVFLSRLNHILQDHHIPQHQQRRFALAVSEAFTNAVIHGNKGNPAGEIKVTLSINSHSIAADITDQGHDGLDKIKNRPQSDLFSEGGRGLRIMQHCATSLSFCQTEEGGLKVSIVLQREKV